MKQNIKSVLNLSFGVLLLSSLIFATSHAASLLETSGANFELPPDPGKAGEQTLQGIDVDNDGLRDDVQRYLYFTYPDELNTRNALAQMAKSFQSALNENLTDELAYNTLLGNREAIGCLYYVSSDGGNQAKALRQIVLNTNARVEQYFLYDQKLTKDVLRISDVPSDERYRLCDFEL